VSSSFQWQIVCAEIPRISAGPSSPALPSFSFSRSCPRFFFWSFPLPLLPPKLIVFAFSLFIFSGSDVPREGSVLVPLRRVDA